MRVWLVGRILDVLNWILGRFDAVNHSDPWKPLPGEMGIANAYQWVGGNWLYPLLPPLDEEQKR